MIMEKDLSIAIKFAQQNGYETAKKVTCKPYRLFGGFQTFDAIFDSEKNLIIGMPQFIIVENDVARFLTDDERDSLMGVKKGYIDPEGEFIGR